MCAGSSIKFFCGLIVNQIQSFFASVKSLTNFKNHFRNRLELAYCGIQKALCYSNTYRYNPAVILKFSEYVQKELFLFYWYSTNYW